jgi:hypothetical protein
MTVQASGGAGRVMFVLIIALSVGLAAVWSVIAQRELTSSITQESATHLDRARGTFDSIRMRTLDNLRAHCRVLVEDPRLKSTLATEGVDEATVTDILGDLAKLRRTGFLMVVSLDGRVFAQAGADELRGLDLSGSSPVKKAQTSLDAVAGSWVLSAKIMDLSIMAVRFGATPIAYLVVGQEIDRETLKALSDQSGVAVASVIGEAITLTSPDDVPKTVFAAVAGQPGTTRGRLFEIDGKTYVTTISELDDSGQSRPRLILMQSLALAGASFGVMKWLIFFPPLLVLVVVLFAMTASRRTVIVRNP